MYTYICKYIFAPVPPMQVLTSALSPNFCLKDKKRY